MPHAALGRVTLLVLCLPALWASPAQAAMYKWVDEKGVTHFSETPPPDGKASKIEARPLPRLSPGAEPKAESWKDRELEFRKRRLEKEQSDEATRTRTSRDADTKRRRCLAAQRELHVLQQGVPIYSINAKGEREYLEDRDRPAEIEAWKRVAEANCER